MAVGDDQDRATVGPRKRNRPSTSPALAEFAGPITSVRATRPPWWREAPDGVNIASARRLLKPVVRTVRLRKPATFAGKLGRIALIDRLIAGAGGAPARGRCGPGSCSNSASGPVPSGYRVSDRPPPPHPSRRLRRRATGAHAAPGHRWPQSSPTAPTRLLSHRSAAAHWGLSPAFLQDRRDHAAQQDGAGKGTTGARKPGSTRKGQKQREDGIPTTTVARTILDLAGAGLRKDPLTNLIEEADRKELPRPPGARSHSRSPAARTPGTKRLKAALGAYRGHRRHALEARRDFRIPHHHRAGLPEPQFNVLVAGPDSRRVLAAMEARRRTRRQAPTTTDPSAFETDRIRDATLQKVRLRVLRVTGNRLDNAPAAVLADILALRRPASST